MTEQATPPFLAVDRLAKRFGGHVALNGCGLDVAQGEIVTLLGPSGCGKTTLLRCIAGFTVPDAGTITLDGRDALAMPVNRRPVGVVFQNYALFPHLTVARNVAYGLTMRGTPRAERDRRVAAALRQVELERMDDRYPGQLSGGQQQRVAIARVLVLEPKLLLLDEPFNALDAKLRSIMQVELRQLIKRLGLTALFVTHDQDEALAMSDRVAVMRSGYIEQVGTPLEVYDAPVSAYVAAFVGASNLLRARASAGEIVLPFGTRIPYPYNDDVLVLVRPQNLTLGPAGQTDWRGRIVFGKPSGASIEYELEMPDGRLLRVAAMREPRAPQLPVGAEVAVAVRDIGSCVVFTIPE